MADIGIRVFVKDAASKALKGIGATGVASLSAVRKVADLASRSFSTMGKGAVVFNQGLELAKKGLDAFKLLIGDTIAAALDFRGANDPVLKQFEEMKRSVEVLRARVGDALIPVVQALGRAFAPVIDATNDWLKANRKLIASNLLHFLGSVATVLTDGIAYGIVIVSKAWAGWQMLIEASASVVTGFFSMVLDGVSGMLGAWESLANAVGADGLGKKLGEARSYVGALGDAFADVSAESSNEVLRISQAQDQLETRTREVAESVKRAIADSVVAGEAMIAASIEGTNRTLREQQDLLEEAEKRAEKRAEREAERLKLLAEIRQANLDRMVEITNKEAERSEAIAKQGAESIESISSDAIAGLGSAFHALFSEQEKGMEAFSKTMLSLLFDMVRKAIEALAAQAAAGAVAQSTATMGPAGIGIGLAAATAVIGIIEGFVSKFADGGFVTGGTPNRDTVPIMAQSGEYVMSQNDVAGFRKFATALLGGNMANQLVAAPVGTEGGSESAPRTQVFIENRIWTPSQREEAEMSRRQARSQKMLSSLGMLGV